MPRKSALRRILVFTALAFVAAGCKADLDDLRLEELSLVEVPPKNGAELDSGRYASPNGDLYRLKVDLASNEDIWKLIKDGGYLLQLNTFFCDDPETNVLMDTGALYWNGQNIMRESLDRESPIARAKPGAKTYSLYLMVYSPAIPSYRESQKGRQVNEYEAYDLAKQAKDVCLTVTGRTMVGGFKSNVVRIPRSLIREKLEGVTSRNSSTS